MAVSRICSIRAALQKENEAAVSDLSSMSLTDHLTYSLSPHHLHAVPTCDPGTGEANARTRLSLRPGWATDIKTLSKGKIKPLVIMISEHFLFVNRTSYFNMSQKLRKESNFTLALTWDKWPTRIYEGKGGNPSADCLSSSVLSPTPPESH